METSTTKKGISAWPFGTWVCDLTFSFERFAFYVAKWLLAIFVAAEAVKGGLGLSQEEGAVMNSMIVAFTYITPVIGGFIADRWVSPRLLVPIGTILMGLGYLCAWQANGLGMLYVMILLVSIGTGFFKGNVSGINGRLFPEADADQMDSVFSIQYSFVNVGSFLGTTIMGVLAGTVLTYRAVFLVCGIFLFIDTIWWIVMGGKFFGDTGKKPFKVDNRENGSEQEKEAKDKTPLTKNEKERVAAIIIVTAFSAIFWWVWYLTYLPVYYHFGPVAEAGAGHANWALGSFTVPTAWFDSLNALCCIILGPVLAGVWMKLAKRPQGDMDMFKKTALGMVLMGAAIAAMVLADIVRGDGQASILWIVLVGVLMSVGEMVFSPLGNSFISKFSPKKLLGLLLGLWPLPIFFVGLTYGFLYNWLMTFPFKVSFGAVAVVVIACGVVLWAMSGKLNGLVHEDEK